MKLIITSTTRKNSLTFSLCKIVEKIYQNQKEKVQILDLKQIPFKELIDAPYSKKIPSSLQPYLEQIAQAEGLILVCPEYNGGIPGLIKHFIDYWIYPDSFVYKPVCFIGLGGRFGALNPISHLQDTFLSRYSFIFPVRVFIQNVSQILKEGQLQDEKIKQLLNTQAINFIKFIEALKTQSFDR